MNLKCEMNLKIENGLEIESELEISKWIRNMILNRMFDCFFIINLEKLGEFYKN